MNPEILPVGGMKEVKPGDDLPRLIVAACRGSGIDLRSGDVVAVSQKIVSKAENRVVRLGDVVPSPLAVQIARESGKDPRHMEVILRESRRVVRMDTARGLLIAENHQGIVCANAGVDRSNAGPGEVVTLLPVDPDASAEALRKGLMALTGVAVGVMITDTLGRPWRKGLVDAAIGLAGLRPLRDDRGKMDRHGYLLHATVLADADAMAAASGLVKGKAEGVPVAVVRGSRASGETGRATDVLRPPEEDLFR